MERRQVQRRMSQRSKKIFLGKKVSSHNRSLMETKQFYFKKLQNRIFIAEEERALSDHKPMKDRLTHLMSGNARGDVKVKLLLINYSDSARVVERNNVMKRKLPVMWRKSAKAWVNRQFFTEWMHDVFALCEKKYLREKVLPLKCLMLLDNATTHPPGLEEDLVK